MLDMLLSSLNNVAPYIIEIMAGIIFGLLLWLIKRYITKLGIEADEKVREYLMEAINASIVYGKNKAIEELGTEDVAEIDNRNSTIAYAVKYVITRVPDAIKKFKLSEEDIRDLVLARLEEK